MTRGNIAPSALPSLDSIKPGPTSALAKPALISLAIALEIPIPDQNKDIGVTELKKLVSNALQSQKFVSDSRFDKFKTYRAAKTSKVASKNSADKSKADLDAAARKADVPPSG